MVDSSVRSHSEVIALDGVTVVRDGTSILSNINWRVQSHERWVVLGPNGAGKTTMLQVASTYMGPTRGTVRLLGEAFGSVDVRLLRERIGYAGPRPAALVRHDLPALDIVVTGKHASFVDRRWHDYEEADWEFGRNQLERLDAGELADRAFGSLSSGERQKVLIARSLMTHPEVLFLDEAMTGLDLGSRERLVAALEALASDAASPAVVLVTHHVEEIPPGFGHIAMLASGRIVASGRIENVLTSSALDACFGGRFRIEKQDGRYRAWSPH
jgi:iron complex transport system ATP-binding protein